MDATTRLDALVATWPPEATERYEPRALLGEGGMGMVLEAFDRRLKRLVAIKTIKVGPAGTERLRARLRREIKLLKDLEHPRIVRLYDAITWPAGELLVMERLEGRGLSIPLRPALPRATILQILADAAEGLAFIHERGMIHRDLKPENLFFETSGRTRILDLGLGRDMVNARQTALTGTHQMLGTLLWLAPEQWKERRPGPPSDVYQLALVAQDLLNGRLHTHDTGIPPLADGSLHAALAAGEQTPPSLPPDVRDLLIRALSTEPGDRPDAEALHHAFRRLLHGDEARAPHEPLSPARGETPLPPARGESPLAADAKETAPDVTFASPHRHRPRGRRRLAPSLPPRVAPPSTADAPPSTADAPPAPLRWPLILGGLLSLTLSIVLFALVPPELFLPPESPPAPPSIRDLDVDADDRSVRIRWNSNDAQRLRWTLRRPGDPTPLHRGAEEAPRKGHAVAFEKLSPKTAYMLVVETDDGRLPIPFTTRGPAWVSPPRVERLWDRIRLSWHLEYVPAIRWTLAGADGSLLKEGRGAATGEALVPVDGSALAAPDLRWIFEAPGLAPRSGRLNAIPFAMSRSENAWLRKVARARRTMALFADAGLTDAVKVPFPTPGPPMWLEDLVVWRDGLGDLATLSASKQRETTPVFLSDWSSAGLDPNAHEQGCFEEGRLVDAGRHLAVFRRSPGPDGGLHVFARAEDDGNALRRLWMAPAPTASTERFLRCGNDDSSFLQIGWQDGEKPRLILRIFDLQARSLRRRLEIPMGAAKAPLVPLPPVSWDGALWFSLALEPVPPPASAPLKPHEATVLSLRIGKDESRVTAEGTLPFATTAPRISVAAGDLWITAEERLLHRSPGGSFTALSLPEGTPALDGAPHAFAFTGHVLAHDGMPLVWMGGLKTDRPKAVFQVLPQVSRTLAMARPTKRDGTWTLKMDIVPYLDASPRDVFLPPSQRDVFRPTWQCETPGRTILRKGGNLIVWNLATGKLERVVRLPGSVTWLHLTPSLGASPTPLAMSVQHDFGRARSLARRLAEDITLIQLVSPEILFHPDRPPDAPTRVETRLMASPWSPAPRIMQPASAP